MALRPATLVPSFVTETVPRFVQVDHGVNLTVLVRPTCTGEPLRLGIIATTQLLPVYHALQGVNQ